jgi:cell division septation protein DedD
MAPPPSPDGRRSQAVLDPPDGNWPADALYAIHVSSFATVEKATAKVDELSAAGYESFVIPAEVSGKGIYHRIFVGSYGDLGLAQADCDQLRQSDAFDEDIHVVDRKWALGN